MGSCEACYGEVVQVDATAKRKMAVDLLMNNLHRVITHRIYVIQY